MMGIVIAPNRLEYCQLKKKDIAKHWFITRKQMYKMFPDQLIAMDIYHDGAFVRSESVTIYTENATTPYHCKKPAEYHKDVLLAQVDEHKIMIDDKRGLLAKFTGVKMEKGQGISIIAGAVALFVVGYGFLSSFMG